MKIGKDIILSRETNRRNGEDCYYGNSEKKPKASYKRRMKHLGSVGGEKASNPFVQSIGELFGCRHK